MNSFVAIATTELRRQSDNWPCESACNIKCNDGEVKEVHSMEAGSSNNEHNRFATRSNNNNVFFNKIDADFQYFLFMVIFVGMEIHGILEPLEKFISCKGMLIVVELMAYSCVSNKSKHSTFFHKYFIISR